VIRDSAVQPEPAEPAIRQIEMSLFTQAALGSDTHAIADDQHADHQLWIDGGATHPAVKRLQRLAQVIEGEMAVNAPKHVVDRHMFLNAEIIEQPRRRCLNAHHRRLSRRISGIQ
jgi:hypothetical protein